LEHAQLFHPVVSRWFSEQLGQPTPAQTRGWKEIRARKHTLIAAPTGSGKTLAAFLAGLDELFREGLQGAERRHSQEPGAAATGHRQSRK
jgi:ATP-dependent helicase Lhr and Lhr-like helicase